MLKIKEKLISCDPIDYGYWVNIELNDDSNTVEHICLAIENQLTGIGETAEVVHVDEEGRTISKFSLTKYK